MTNILPLLFTRIDEIHVNAINGEYENYAPDKLADIQEELNSLGTELDKPITENQVTKISLASQKIKESIQTIESIMRGAISKIDNKSDSVVENSKKKKNDGAGDPGPYKKKYTNVEEKRTNKLIEKIIQEANKETPEIKNIVDVLYNITIDKNIEEKIQEIFNYTEIENFRVYRDDILVAFTGELYTRGEATHSDLEKIVASIRDPGIKNQVIKLLRLLMS